MNLNTDNIHQILNDFLQEMKVDIELASNKEMADMYEVRLNDVVCLDGGVYLVRISSECDRKNTVRFIVDKETSIGGSYWNPPDVDVSNVVTTYSFNEAAYKAIDTILYDRMVNASMNMISWEDEVDYNLANTYA